MTIVFGKDTMQFPWIDEIQGFLLDRKRVHIDLKAESAAGKIQNFNLVVPVVFYKIPFPTGKSLIKSAGKRLCAVGACFF